MLGLRGKIWWAGALLAATVACNTPSVPLPPPELPALSFQAPATATGQFVLQGMPSTHQANARFFVLDLTSGDGVITTCAADGSFTSGPFTAQVGDTIDLSYETPAGEHSGEACVPLQANTPLLSIACP
jgi:hypothetical protein